MADGIGDTPSTAQPDGDAPQPLVQRLRAQYGGRWPVLLDALFSLSSGSACQSAALHNRFASPKARGEPLLAVREVALTREPEAATRHTDSGLLSHYETRAAAVLPALALSPLPGGSLLVLGRPPAGRLLALAQLVFGQAAASEAPGSPTRRRGRTASRSLASAPSLREPADAAEAGPDSPPSVQRALPAFIYGDGPQQQQDEVAAPSPPGGPAQPWAGLGWGELYWGGLGSLVEGLLFRGVRAGCCTVRTKSGDWAELAEAAAAEPPAPEGTELPQLQPAAGEGSLECVLPDEGGRRQLAQLLEHHVPQGVRRRIRLTTPAPDAGWPPGLEEDSYDTVVVEAQCAASAAAAVAACQAGKAAPWPSPAQAGQIAQQARLLMAGFQALRPGGLLLFCSASLVWQETEGLVQACCSQLGPSAAPLPQLSCGAGAELEVLLKRLGAERGECGWRLLPDLSLEGPAFFSLVRRLPASA